jgi:hypothetical protein
MVRILGDLINIRDTLSSVISHLEESDDIKFAIMDVSKDYPGYTFGGVNIEGLDVDEDGLFQVFESDELGDAINLAIQLAEDENTPGVWEVVGVIPLTKEILDRYLPNPTLEQILYENLYVANNKIDYF